MRALAALAVLCLGARDLLAQGEEIINLELNPASTTINVGDTVEVALIARAVMPPTLGTAGIQVILDWDPSVLALAGFVSNTAPEYVWLLDGFDDDSSLDDLNAGLNDPPVGVPDNDGDAFYSALSQLAVPPVVTTGGLQVTRFLFEAVGASPLTQINLPLSFGQFTVTAAFSNTVPGLNILGDAFGTQITVVPEPATAAFLILLSTGFVRSRRGKRIL